MFRMFNPDGSYGPATRCGCKGGGPYGKAFGKGKKGAPKFEKPLVNPNQINPAKEPFDGGISFKNILQEKVAKKIHRPIQPGDVIYTCTKVKGGRSCTLTMSCLGEEHIYESDQPGADEKQAGQIAASKALEALFPDVSAAVLEAHNAAKEGLAEPGSIGAALDLEGEPKGLLNQRVQLCARRPLETGDIVYETKWQPVVQGYVSILTLNALDGEIYESDLSCCTDMKQAEKDAARKALEAHQEVFDLAMLEHEEKKMADDVKKKAKNAQRGKGHGTSSTSNSRDDSNRSHHHVTSPPSRAPVFSYGHGPPPHAYGMPPAGYGMPPVHYGMPPHGYAHPAAYGMPPPGAYGMPPHSYGAVYR